MPTLGFGGAQGKAPGEAACSLARNEAATQPCAGRACTHRPGNDALRPAKAKPKG